MTNMFFGAAFVSLTALLVILADYAIKVAADANQPIWSWLVVGACALYAVSALFWFFAVQHVSLVQAGVAYSMLTLLALACIGAVWFGEQLYMREYAGLACALIAMVLMSRLS